MNPIEEARKLVRNLNQRMTTSSYDVAWMARMRAPTNNDARWSDLIEWLLENQHPDGSWGGKIIELWLSKSTYAPHDIARSAVLAALILHHATFGHEEY